ncbi:MAG: SLBB domain-containing protein [Candidatus Hydrogenedentes bacterium]|nr:SLBB domain-containing protein [Candidatus Hydrogenedentota bacterium]
MTHHTMWAGRHGAVLVLAVFFAAVSAHAGVLKKKETVAEIKSPIVESVRVSTKGLLPESLQPGDAAPQQSTTAESAATPEGSVKEAPAEYTLGPGDTLSFQSFDDPTLSRTQVIVLFDGTISLPLIKEDLQVNGKTRAQAEAMAVEAYKKIFIEPQLALNISAATSKYYYVLGDVANPTRFPYTNKINILEAVNVAGGLRITQRSGGESYAATTGTLTKAFLIRSASGKREVIELDLRGLTKVGPHPSETPVLPGDVVYIPENVNLVYVLGEVRQPSVFQLYEGQTLLQVLTQAGGFNESEGKLREVGIIRPVDAENVDVYRVDLRQVLKTGADFPMRPGDVIYIPRKSLVRVQEFVSRLTGTISSVLSLYTQTFDAYYADERNRLLVDSGDDGNNLLNTLQTIRGFIGTGNNSSAALSTLSILSAQQQQP